MHRFVESLNSIITDSVVKQFAFNLRTNSQGSNSAGRTFNTSTTKEITMVESDNNLMNTIAKINGKEKQIVIDTGASQSVIPLSFVEKFNIPFHHSNITCNFGNNSKQENVPVTNPNEIILFDTAASLEFLVLPRHNMLY